jgi:hypothetical protein
VTQFIYIDSAPMSGNISESWSSYQQVPIANWGQPWPINNAL